jgi:hypothetical protein
MTEHDDDNPKRDQPSVAPHPRSEEDDAVASSSDRLAADGEPVESPASQSGAGAAEELAEAGRESAGTIRELLRGALGKDEPVVPDMLHGVQRRIRARSKGKFFADGWSTTRQPPISTFLVTSLFMLAILVLVYLVLSPLAGAPVEGTAPAEPDSKAPAVPARPKGPGSGE